MTTMWSNQSLEPTAGTFDFNETLPRVCDARRLQRWLSSFSLDLMSPLEQRTIEHWQEAARDLGFRFVAPFALDDTGQTLTYLGWLPQFGGGHGMLIITSDSLDDQQRLMDAARARDFVYSCMSASDEPYDRNVIIEVLNDWGWSSSEPAPSWYQPSPDCHV